MAEAKRLKMTTEEAKKRKKGSVTEQETVRLE